MQECHSLCPSVVLPNVALGNPVDPNSAVYLCSWHFTNYDQVINWSRGFTFLPLRTSVNSVYRGSRSTSIFSTLQSPKPIVLNICLVDWSLSLGSLRFISELLRQFSHSIQTILRGHWCSNTEVFRISPLLDGHIYEPYSWSDLWLINRCRVGATDVWLVNANPAYRIHDDASSDVRSSD